MHRKRLLILLSCLLGACAARVPGVDPQAAREDARITAKSIDHRKAQPRADAPSVGPAMVGIMGPSGLMVENTLPTRTTIAVYRYAVTAKNGTTVEVLSESPAFELGECVVLLTSSKPGYPRLARGGDCGGMRGTGKP